MTNLLIKLNTELSRLFQDKINIVIFLLATNLIFTGYAFVKIKKKIDYRYFNTTTTIEQIHNVRVDTYNGELKPIVKK